MNVTERVPLISREDLMILGVNDVAYVKPVVADGNKVYAVHAADGTRISIMTDRDLAFAAIRSHDMEPVSVH